MRAVLVRTASGKFQQEITSGPHRLLADEPADKGGDDTGLAPHDLVLAGLGACTAMTLQMYAARKSLPLERVEVELTGAREGEVFRIERRIRVEGALTDEDRASLLRIADKCPVHRTLTGTVQVESTLT